MPTTKNYSFIQLSDPDGIEAMQLITKENPMAANVFYLLMKNMDKQNCLIVSMSTLASKLHVCRNSISRAIKYLRENKYIAIYKSGTTNVYTLNANIVWKDRGDRKMEALLYGKVLLSLDEQDDDIQANADVKKQLEVVK